MYRVKCAHSCTLYDGLTYSAGICVLESVNSLVPQHFQLFLPMWFNPFLGLQFEKKQWEDCQSVLPSAENASKIPRKELLA